MVTITNIPSSVRANVTRCQVYIHPLVDVFHVELITDESVWEESYGSEAELNAFLKGVQAGCSMVGHLFIRPEIPREASKRYDEAQDERDSSQMPPF